MLMRIIKDRERREQCERRSRFFVQRCDECEEERGNDSLDTERSSLDTRLGHSNLLCTEERNIPGTAHNI